MPADGYGGGGAPKGTGGPGTLAPGRKVGAARYELIRPLGQGGMGVVWLAHDSRLDEDVALKFVPPEIRGDASALDELRRETLKCRHLTHPNIIRIHDLDESPGERPFIAMEYVDGPSLAALKAQQEQRLFTWDFLQPLVQQLCEALDYAHGEKVIHRDLKPANMMLDSRGRLKLADFGLAAVLNDSLSRASQAKDTSGTPTYMSPQQILGKTPQPTDDIYSLGSTLYDLLTGKPPFYQGNVLQQVKESVPPPPDQRLAELGRTNAIPPEVAALIMACLAKEPGKRPSSARAVADWIGLTLASVPLAATRWSRRKLALAVGVAVIGLALVAGIRSMRPDDGGAGGLSTGMEDVIEEGWVQVFEPGRTDYLNFRDKWRWSGNVLVGVGDKPNGMTDFVTYTNVQVKADARFRRGAVGQLVLRSTRTKKAPPPFIGYGIKIGNTPKDYRQTGSVPGFQDVLDSHVVADEWFTLHAIIVGQRIVVRLNGRTVVDHTHTGSRQFQAGTIGLSHGENPTVMFRNVRAQALPDDEDEAWKLVLKAAPDLK
jgi:hypothetical protein